MYTLLSIDYFWQLCKRFTGVQKIVPGQLFAACISLAVGMRIRGATVLLFFNGINKRWKIVTGNIIDMLLGDFLRSDSIVLHQTNQQG